VIINYTEMRVYCSLPWLPALSDLYVSSQAPGNNLIFFVEYLLTKQTIARRQEWANKDISVKNINNYDINRVTRLIHFLTLYFQQHGWDYYLEYWVSLGRNNFLTCGVEIRKLEITCMSSYDVVTTDFWSLHASGGALYIMFENHARSSPLLKIPLYTEVICLDTFVYICIPF
jgi:hypothetical protein